jgi:hypothetical protein
VLLRYRLGRESSSTLITTSPHGIAMNGEEPPRAGRVPTEDEFFGGQGTAGAIEAPGWMDNATRVVYLTQRTSEGRRHDGRVFHGVA